MKKTLLFMCMMGLCVLSYAQIALEETFANEFIVLGELSGGKALNVIGYTASAMGGGHYHAGAEHKLFCRFYHDRLAFGIYVITANRFDDHLEIVLGEDFETAQQAFSDLLYWYDNSHKGQSVSFTDVWGRKVQIDRRQDHILVRIIDDVEFKVIADNVILKRSNLVRGINLLNNPEKKEKVYLKLIGLGLSDHPFAVAYSENLAQANEKYDNLMELKDVAKEQMYLIRKELKSAKKNKDKETVSLLKDSLDILRLKYNEIMNELSRYNVAYEDVEV